MNAHQCYLGIMDKYKTVEEYIAGLDSTTGAQVAKLREFILAADKSLVEHIKWNAPSYVKDDVDRITFNTANKNGMVRLVFHMGAARKEDRQLRPSHQISDMIVWVSDIRGYVTFASLEMINSNELAIKQMVRDWLETN
jgi:hypothetical protein